MENNKIMTSAIDWITPALFTSVVSIFALLLVLRVNRKSIPSSWPIKEADHSCIITCVSQWYYGTVYCPSSFVCLAVMISCAVVIVSLYLLVVFQSLDSFTPGKALGGFATAVWACLTDATLWALWARNLCGFEFLHEEVLLDSMTISFRRFVRWGLFICNLLMALQRVFSALFRAWVTFQILKHHHDDARWYLCAVYRYTCLLVTARLALSNISVDTRESENVV